MDEWASLGVNWDLEFCLKFRDNPLGSEFLNNLQIKEEAHERALNTDPDERMILWEFQS